jgi:hypothetical protein
MEQLTQRYLDDYEAQVFYALTLYKAHREDADALQAAVPTLVYQALDGAG